MHHSPAVHSRLQTCRSSLLEGAPSSLPISGWEQIPEGPGTGLTGLTGAQLWVHAHALSPSPAQEPSPALTPWLAPPEAARRLKSCASLLCELGREQWARSDQGFSAGPADSHTHRDGIPRQGRHLHRAPGIYCTCPSPETHRVPGSDGLFRFRDLPKPNRDPKLFFMKD